MNNANPTTIDKTLNFNKTLGQYEFANRHDSMFAIDFLVRYPYK
ncbi:hypothetical protein OSR52_15325 [Galbibacter sp. CMA-7]|uniref:Uncharacterized protein n=1 Tax=Galbibacter pacificus TaxID=2996052 RepID=A0ABT6FVX8_9FLAO|nr:hypothetical protein [Galbibacter pacificus]MDG3583840.1 hypothetical protein [Galbibacter pacificus]MDG3587242.1 hypothetical protein [Galbibacter pacificus]